MIPCRLEYLLSKHSGGLTWELSPTWSTNNNKIVTDAKCTKNLYSASSSLSHPGFLYWCWHPIHWQRGTPREEYPRESSHSLAQSYSYIHNQTKTDKPKCACASNNPHSTARSKHNQKYKYRTYRKYRKCDKCNSWKCSNPEDGFSGIIVSLALDDLFSYMSGSLIL